MRALQQLVDHFFSHLFLQINKVNKAHNGGYLSMPPQNSKQYATAKLTVATTVWKSCQFCESSMRCRNKIQPRSPEFSSRHAVFLQLLACLGRHPSAFTSICGTDMAGRGALEPPPEGGARTKLYSTENSSSRIAYFGRDEKLLTKSLTPNKDFIYMY